MKRLIPLLSVLLLLLSWWGWRQWQVAAPPYRYFGVSGIGRYYEEEPNRIRYVARHAWRMEYRLTQSDGTPMTVNSWNGWEAYSGEGLVGALTLTWLGSGLLGFGKTGAEAPYSPEDILQIGYSVDWHRLDPVTAIACYDPETGRLFREDGEPVRDLFSYQNFDFADHRTIDVCLSIHLADGRRITETAILKLR